MNWDAYPDDPALQGFAAVEEGPWRILALRGAEAWAGAVVRGEVEVVGHVGGGRAMHPVVAGPEWGRAVVRHYRRGGLMRHVNRERYFLGQRAFDELLATERARVAGVRVPEVLMAAQRRRGFGYTGLLATRVIPEAVGLDEWLARTGDAGLPALGLAGDQIRRMHDGGIAHPDLNLRNLLVTIPADEAMAVFVIDFDRARLTAQPVASDRRARDLRRLARSARKLGVGLDGERWSALRDGYGAGWPLLPGEG